MQQAPIPKTDAQRLVALHSLNILDTSPEERFDRVTRLAKHLFNVPIALIGMVDANRQWFKSCQGLAINQMPRAISFCGHAIMSEEAFIVPNALDDERFADNPVVTGEPYVRFYAGKPLSTADGNRVGTLCIIDTKPRQLNTQEINLLQDLAAVVENEMNLVETHLLQQRLIQTNQKLEAREKALRESETRLQQVFNSISDHIYVTEYRADGQCLNRYLSPAEPLTGYQTEQLAADWDFWTSTLIHPDDRAYAALQVERFRQGQSSEIEYRLIRADGQVIWVRDSGRVEREGDNIVVYGVVSNISKRKRIEEELRLVAAENLRLARAVDAATEGIVITDPKQPDNPLIYVNPAFTEITGYPAEEVLGKNCRFLQGPETAPEAIEQIRCALSECQEIQVTLLNYRRDGQPFWNELNISPIFSDEGSPLYFVGIQSNVTHRKAAEEAQVRFTNQLRTAADVSKQITAILEPDKLLREIITLLQSRFDLYHVHIYLLDAQTDNLVMQAGSGEIGRLLLSREHKIALTFEHSLVAKAARDREIVLVNDISSEPDFMPNPLLPETKAEVAVPLMVGDQVWGVLDCQDNRIDRFTPSDLDTFRTLSGQIVIALENAYHFEEERRIKTALRESEARNRAILGAIPDLMFRINSQGDYIDFNVTSPKDLYVSPDEFIGKSVQETLPSDVAELTMHYINQAIETSQLQIYEYQLTIPGQSPQNFEARLVVSGENEVLAIIRNVTEWKRAEQALQQSQQKLAYHLQNTPVGFIQWNADVRVEEWNPAAEKIFGFSRAEALGQNPTFVVPPELHTYIDQIKQALLSQTGGRHSTNENIAKDGRRIMCEWDNTPLLDEAGNLIGVASLVQDITERIHAQEDLAKARDQALEASRLKSELLAKVSHELRTPLMAISGFTEMIEFGIYGPIDEQKRQPLKEIIESSQYLTTLVNELLDQAQLDTGKFKLNLGTLNPVNLVDDIQANMKVLAQAKNLALTIDFEPDIPSEVTGDAPRIRQILVNLVTNAIKFTDKGSVHVHVFCPNQHTWAVEIIDTGQGIPVEKHKKIFEPFEQVDGSITRKQKGYGLGLSIVKQLVDLMEGKITLESSVGQGSIFTVEFPLKPEGIAV